jgi:hypothetical protein
MSGGRRAAAVGAVCIAALVVALPGSAGAATGDSFFPRFPHFPHVKVRTDGTLTVGQQETLYVKGVPRRPKLKNLSAYISPPDSASGCFVSFEAYCAPEPLFPVAGTSRLKASKKGRARLTFVMPPAYEFLDMRDPLNSHPVTLIDGQAVHAEVDGTQRSGGIDFTAPIGHAIAVVQVLPPPTS